MIEHFVTTYGYFAVWVGTLFEGETIVVLATLAAHRGYLALGPLVACAAAGAFTADQLAFHVGRRRGARIFARWPRLARHVGRAERLSARHARWLGFVFRMTVGLRTVLPMLWGMGGMSSWRFLWVDAVAVAVWVTAVVSLGWLLGAAAERLLGELARDEGVLFGGVVLAAAAIAVGRRWRAHRRGRPGDAEAAVDARADDRGP